MNSKVSVTELFSREEIRELTTPSDLQGALAVSSTWAVIVLTLAQSLIAGNIYQSGENIDMCLGISHSGRSSAGYGHFNARCLTPQSV